MALPLLDAPSEIVLTSELQSAPYVELTRSVQAQFGIETAWCGNTIVVKPGEYRAFAYQVGGDWSHAAFYAVAGALGSDVCMKGLNLNSAQGDKQILDILQQMGCVIEHNDDSISVKGGSMHGITVDVAACPDLVPILTVAACVAEGETRIVNAARLRLKESDRLHAISSELNKLGANIEQLPDGLIIKGGTRFTGGEVCAHNDHRIAMSLAIAATVCSEAVILDEPSCVAKSAPAFWQEFQSLGGMTDER